MICGYCQKVILRNLTVKEILFPWLLSDTELCSQCLRQFTPIQKDQACPRCMRSGEQDLCADCQCWQKQYPQRQFFHQALYQYDESFANWLKEYKFGGDYRLRRTFQQQVRVALKGYRGFIICPIPLSQSRYQERGFNQTSAFLEASGVKTHTLLRRSSHDSPQSKKNRQERLALPQPYVLACSPELLIGKKILLVDDVYTTGRTLFHAADILWQHQPKEVRTFSLAR